MKVVSPLFSSMRGSLGGAVGSVARGGITYFRAKVIPTNPRTLLQTAIRQAVQSASAIWLGVLTELQQENWFDIATGTQTGKSLFTKVNQPRIYASNTGRVTDTTGAPDVFIPAYFGDPPDDGSLSTPFLLPTEPVIDDSANTLKLPDVASAEWNADADGTHTAGIFVYLSGPQTASRFARQRPYQLVRAYTVPDAVGSVVLAAINLAALGIPTVVDRVFYVKVYAQDAKGRVSLPVEYRVTVVA